MEDIKQTLLPPKNNKKIKIITPNRKNQINKLQLVMKNYYKKDIKLRKY